MRLAAAGAALNPTLHPEACARPQPVPPHPRHASHDIHVIHTKRCLVNTPSFAKARGQSILGCLPVAASCEDACRTAQRCATNSTRLCRHRNPQQSCQLPHFPLGTGAATKPNILIHTNRPHSCCSFPASYEPMCSKAALQQRLQPCHSHPTYHAQQACKLPATALDTALRQAQLLLLLLLRSCKLCTHHTHHQACLDPPTATTPAWCCCCCWLWSVACSSY